MVKDMGSFIRQLRQKLGMTQEEFAHALGITVSTVNRWENSHSAPSKLARSAILQFAATRGVSPDELSQSLARSSSGSRGTE